MVKCRKLDVYGEMGMGKSAIFSQGQEAPRQSDFSGGPFATNAIYEENQQESSWSDEEIKLFCLKKSNQEHLVFGQIHLLWFRNL